MTTHLTEEEQVAQIKALWHTYGRTVITALVLGLIISLGLRYWHERQTAHLSQAAIVYEQMLLNDMKNNKQAIVKQGQHLLQRFQETSYASFAGLMLARQAVNDKDLKAAQEKLNWVLKQTKSSSVRQVARLRAARIYLEMKQPQQALQLLNKIDDSAFLPAINEVKGDAYIALRNHKKARQLYTAALKHVPKGKAAFPFLQMKLDELGGALQQADADVA
jgi:predicted negative regulator of RcsB-dependent stress response